MFRTLSFLFLIIGLLPSSALAAAGEWQRDENVAVRLISEVDGTRDPDDTPHFALGLEIELAPGWHTYWRSPGLAGAPPKIDWSKSQNETGNLEAASLLYPIPERFQEQGIETIGYSGHIVLPIMAKLIANGKPAALNASVDLLICGTQCVPKHFDLQLDIPEGEAKRSAEADLIDAFVLRVPGNPAVIAITRVERNKDSVLIVFTSARRGKSPDIFVENDENILLTSTFEENFGPDSAAFILKPAEKLPEHVSLETLPLTVTIVDEPAALELRIDGSFSAPPALVPPPPVDEESPPSFWTFILLALLGGFILNLTPCVLPVLSLKIISVISHCGSESRIVRRSFLTTALGIVFSFMVLAGATILLKETGRAFGWGVQFQQPGFLVFLILLLTLFAANLWDVFTIALPRCMADRFDPLYHPKLAGDFLTGAFATLLATPCSVPFLGTAVGFAMTQGTNEILAIFAALGLGMTMPYLAVAAWPRLASFLPRPGHWMITIRKILGFALALTAVWLLFVLKAEIPVYGAIAVAICMAGLVSVLYTLRNASWTLASRIIAAAFVLLAFGAALLPQEPVAQEMVETLLPEEAIENEPQQQGSTWKTFDEKALRKYVRDGKTVFVDVTADWCVNCKANKKLILSRKEVKHCLFDKTDVIAMRADWTNPNPAIADFLKRHGRYGIPFNAVFGPKAPEGLVLPELLTPGKVLDGLAKAQNKPSPC